jgi:hypothetical protein
MGVLIRDDRRGTLASAMKGVPPVPGNKGGGLSNSADLPPQPTANRLLPTGDPRRRLNPTYARGVRRQSTAARFGLLGRYSFQATCIIILEVLRVMTNKSGLNLFEEALESGVVDSHVVEDA